MKFDVQNLAALVFVFGYVLAAELAPGGSTMSNVGTSGQISTPETSGSGVKGVEPGPRTDVSGDASDLGMTSVYTSVEGGGGGGMTFTGTSTLAASNTAGGSAISVTTSANTAGGASTAGAAASTSSAASSAEGRIPGSRYDVFAGVVISLVFGALAVA